MVPPETLANGPTGSNVQAATVVVVVGATVVVVVVVDVVEVVDVDEVVVDDVVVVVGVVLTRGEVKWPVLILAPPVLVQALPFKPLPGVMFPFMESDPLAPTVSWPWKLQVVTPVALTPVLEWPFPFPPFECPFAIATPPPAATISDSEMTSGAINRECFFIVTSNRGLATVGLD
jgi:hypothetical protein